MSKNSSTESFARLLTSWRGQAGFFSLSLFLLCHKTQAIVKNQATWKTEPLSRTVQREYPWMIDTVSGRANRIYVLISSQIELVHTAIEHAYLFLGNHHTESKSHPREPSSCLNYAWLVCFLVIVTLICIISVLIIHISISALFWFREACLRWSQYVSTLSFGGNEKHSEWLHLLYLVANILT